MSNDRAGQPARIRKFNIEELLEPHPPRTNFYVAYVDGAYAIRVAKIRDTFPKHCHPNGDEAWFVYRGRLRIDSDWGPVELKSGEGTVIPKGIRHSPTCLEAGTLVLVMHIKEFQTVPLNESELAASGYMEIDAPLTDGG
jgi:mannose-6-phosphate isomerase-like protein (cupin superfamily)